MANGRWGRWGRGDCRGYSIEFGPLVRIDINRFSARADAPARFAVSYPKKSAARFDTLEEALAWAEEQIAFDMAQLHEDWARFERGAAARRFAPKARTRFAP